MGRYVVLGLVLFAFSCGLVLAQAPGGGATTAPTREGYFAQVLTTQRNAGFDGLAACFADKQVEVDGLAARVVELDRQLQAARAELAGKGAGPTVEGK